MIKLEVQISLLRYSDTSNNYWMMQETRVSLPQARSLGVLKASDRSWKGKFRGWTAGVDCESGPREWTAGVDCRNRLEDCTSVGCFVKGG